MAMVKFWRGLKANYTAATKDAATLYFITDDQELYLGATLIADYTDLTSVNTAIQALQNAGYQNANQVQAIVEEALKDYTSTVTQQGIDAAQNELIAGLRADLDEITEVGGEPNKVDDVQVNGTSVVVGKIANIDISGKLDVSAYNTDKQAQTEKDAAQDKALTDYKAEMVETLKGYQTTIPAETYDAFGAAATAEQNAKDYADQALIDFENAWIKADENGTVDKLNEIAAWLNTEGAGAQKIIADVATNATNIATNVADIDKIEAKLNGIAEGNGTVKAAIDAVDGKFADYTKTADLGDLATKDSLTAAEVGAYTKTETEDAIDLKIEEQHFGTAAYTNSDAYATAAQGTDGSTAFSWGNHADAGYAKTADISTDIAKGVSAKEAIDANKTVWDKAGTAVQPGDLGDLANKDIVTKDEIDTSVYDMIVNGDAAHTAISNPTTGLTAAHTKAQQGIDDAATALAKANEKTTLAEAKTAIQGSTTETVADVVAAVNKLADGQATTDGALRTANSNINELFAALTWIEG